MKKRYSLLTIMVVFLLIIQSLNSFAIPDPGNGQGIKAPAVWILSVGIDDYGSIVFKNCKSDASSFIEFFKDQYRRLYKIDAEKPNFNSFLLLDKDATKDSIMKVLKIIASKASPKDYFIFNYSGESNTLPIDSVTSKTFFYPYEVTGEVYKPSNRNKNDTSDVKKQMLSLQIVQEHIQLIPAIRQLIISEAGPSAKFKSEFIKMLMQNSPEVASILNKNRVIIIPNNSGLDNFKCKGTNIAKGPINYFITSLDALYNVYDIFNPKNAPALTYQLESPQYTCDYFFEQYFKVFFERDFLKEYNDISGDEGNATRGITPKAQKKNEAAGLIGRHVALVIGTDHYASKDWPKLSNPIFDAEAISAELTNSYGFDVTLLKDPPMDSIYAAIGRYFRTLQSNDQLLIYFAGHGDFDEDMLDDGFIVCSNSKSVEDDPMRNTYIQYSRLKRMINKIPAKQILILSDVCHGGVFDDRILGTAKRDGVYKSINNKNVLNFLNEKAPYKVRRLLSSVGKESAFDGRAGKHSPFANLLMQVLRAKGEGKNGIVTLSDIYAVLQTSSMNEDENLKIAPHIANFQDDDPLGEFILIPVEQNSQVN